jgi:GH24 family phage-related lysozyme (muramidase)
VRKPLGILITSIVLLGLLPAHAGAVSLKTTRFVGSFEGFLSCVYADPAGHATIGYGHLLHLGAPTKKDRKKWGCLTKHQGLKLLRKDLQATEDEVLDRLQGASISPSILTALDSFAFNLGAGALDHTPKEGRARATNIALHVRQGRYRKAGKEMLLFDGIIVHGKRYELEGLRIRRHAEYHLMIKGINEPKTCDGSCKSNTNPGGLGPG